MHEYVSYHVKLQVFINATCIDDCNEALQFVYVCIMTTRLDSNAEMFVNITRICILKNEK